MHAQSENRIRRIPISGRQALRRLRQVLDIMTGPFNALHCITFLLRKRRELLIVGLRDN